MKTKPSSSSGLHSRRKMTGFLLVLLMILVLTACKDADGEDPGVTTLIYANLTEIPGRGPDREAIDTFNRTHTDVQIEVRDYFSDGDKSGRERLITEMMAGQVPDIIDLGYDREKSMGCILPYRSLAKKDYLEDLWPYIENDPELGRDSLMEAPLKAAEIDGGLYVAFPSFILETLLGPASIVGDRHSWSLEELQEIYAAMPEGSTLMGPAETRSEWFASLGAVMLDSYVDWDTGECNYNSDSFRNVLEFLNSFPAECDIPPEDFKYLGAEQFKLCANGQQLLIGSGSQPTSLQVADMQFGEKTAYIGFPVADGSVGSYFFPSITPRLAISTTCKDKEAAWEYVRQIFLPKLTWKELKEEKVLNYIPINRADYDLLMRNYHSGNIRITYNIAGLEDPIKLRPVTEEEIARYDDIIDSIDKILLFDTAIYDIVKEISDAYFAGAKTLDETVNLIQNRVQLYVNENR